MKEITYRSKAFFDDLADHADRHVHLILIATKPDIIKQIPLYRELKKRGHCVVLGHTGQHYDENLSGGMLREFGVEPDFNLNVRGSMYEIVSQIIGRLGYVMEALKKRNKIVIPYVHGDTTTAMAAANAGYCHAFASVHVEAGIRTLTPKYAVYGMSYAGNPDIQHTTYNIQSWREFLMDRNNWERGSLEPYPEQFNTRSAETATGIHLAPVRLDREFLLSEGFPEDRIAVVGNSVVDATEEALERVGIGVGVGVPPFAEASGGRGVRVRAAVFDRYPILEKGDFVRFCIHRRENCVSEKRFMSIYNAMKQLIGEGRTVLLINMNQTKAAFERFGLTRDVTKLAADHPNFIFSDVWPEYGDVIAAMSRAAVCATDSGSMQEEMNALSVPCVTLRYGSDRSESAIAGGNLIAPPVDASLIKKIIEFSWNNQDMRKAPKLYGENVSAKSIDLVENVLKTGEVFRTEEERLRL